MSYNHNLERTLAIIGSPSVGKSALSQVFVTRTFPNEYYPTIEKSNCYI
jgi:GTPase SAR1 family protein